MGITVEWEQPAGESAGEAPERLASGMPERDERVSPELRRRWARRTVAAGVVAAVAAVTAWWGGGSQEAARYVPVAPKRVAGYRLINGGGSGEAKPLPGVRGSTDFSAGYERDAASGALLDDGKETVFLSGVQGEVHDPDRAVRALIHDLAELVGMTGDVRTYRPVGVRGVVLLCATLDRAGTGNPVCAWADNSTAVVVMTSHIASFDGLTGLTRTFHEAVRGKAA